MKIINKNWFITTVEEIYYIKLDNFYDNEDNKLPCVNLRNGLCIFC